MKIASFWKTAKRWLIYGGSAQLRPYEKGCLEAWRKMLTEEGRSLLDEQLKRISYVKRQASDKLVCFYDADDQACEHWPEAIFFPCRLAEVEVARITMRGRCNQKTSTIKSDIMLCKGRFFGLEFNKSPAILANGFEIVKLDTLFDPMLQCYEDGITHDKREQLISAIDAKLPDEYLALIANGKPSVINGWQIYDPAQVRKIPQPEHNYYLLAEKEGAGAIAVAQEGQSGQLYYLDYEDDIPVKIQTSLRTFCECN